LQNADDLAVAIEKAMGARMGTKPVPKVRIYVAADYRKALDAARKKLKDRYVKARRPEFISDTAWQRPGYGILARASNVTAFKETLSASKLSALLDWYMLGAADILLTTTKSSYS